ncbi:hypothetical protein PFISCL1PPCAC_7536, partial [Pristionchus fissidentatus]
PLPNYLLVHSSCLLSLFTRCFQCGQESIEAGTMKAEVLGSALILNWHCLFCGEDIQWISQPRLEKKYHEGNVKLTCASYTTGLSIPRLMAMAKEMDLAVPCERTVRKQLAEVVIPAVDVAYKEHLAVVQETVRGVARKDGVHLAVDGRYDSPGYTATNCTVSFVSLETNLILHIVNMHKRMPGIDGVSGRMEKDGVRRGLKEIIANQFSIRSMVSDNDARISKMMREDPSFKKIRHLLDFWHIIKGMNSALRELSKKNSCPNISYWRNKIVKHGYFVHFRYGRNRKRAVNYWKSVLPHVTGRHKHFHKVPFLSGIKRCKHMHLPESIAHQIDRKSEEYHLFKNVITRPAFLSAFERAAPKKNTSPNESFNAIVNLYAPKRLASSPSFYKEKVKLATMHFNTISYGYLEHTRTEKSSYSVEVKGRESKSVKRRMTAVEHQWRGRAWAAVSGVIRKTALEAWMKRNHAPDDNALTAALVEEANDKIDEELVERKKVGEDDGDESDWSVELGGGYGEEVDSDEEPIAESVVMSDEEDASTSEDEEEKEAKASSGSEWDEGTDVWSQPVRGRVRGRGRPRGSRGAKGGRATNS